MNNEKFIKAQKVKDDEFYTPYQQFELWLKYCLLDKLKDKIIYCPCDSEWSNIVKVLQDYKDQLQYKELIYTSNDFRTNGKLFDYCDIVITNPPFSLASEWYNFLKEHNCKFFSYGSQEQLYKVYLQDDIISGRIKVKHNYEIPYTIDYGDIKLSDGVPQRELKRSYLFIRPDGTYKPVAYCIYTNIDGIENIGTDIEFNTKLEDIEDKWGYLDNTKILNVLNWKKFPADFDGIAAISPIKYMRWYDKFDIVSADRKFIDPLLKKDGKNVFRRWLVKLKGSRARIEDSIMQNNAKN